MDCCAMDMLDRDNILSVLDAFTLTDADDVAMDMAKDFRKRRIEKGITREMMAEESGVALSNIARFEQKGLISLKNLIKLAMSLQYVGELKGVFSVPKYSTMDDLLEIRRNSGKKKVYRKNRS